MKTVSKLGALGGATIALLLATSAAAHHGDAGRYNETQTTISGTVVALQLVNPHSTIVVDVEDQSGEVVRWRVELGNPRGLSRNYGWDRNTLQPGDELTLTGRQVRSGAPYLNMTENAQIARSDSGDVIYETDNYQAPSAAAAQ